jgi:diacylglycerol O-acyltransferase
MYWQGCKLSGLYPVSLIIDGVALNITLTSRQDFVDFGLIACRKTLPHVQRLLDYLEEGLADLEASLG